MFPKDRKKEAALVIAFDKARKGKGSDDDSFDSRSRDPMEREGDEGGERGDMESAFGSLGQDAVDAIDSGDGLEFAKAVIRIIHAHQDACDEDCPGHAEDSDDGGY